MELPRFDDPQQLRREGRVPCVYYKNTEEPVGVSVDALELNRLLNTEFTVVNLKVTGGKAYKCVIRDIQRDPITDEFVHVDFLGIQMDKPVRISVPVVLSGTPQGVRDGGVLEHLLREVEVEGLPMELPEHIELDVSGMGIGHSLTLADVPADKFHFVTDLKHAVATVQKTKVAKGAEAAEAEAEEAE